MKIKKIIALTLTVIFAVSLLASCGSDGKEALYSKDGVEIKSVSVIVIDEKAYNFSVVAANSNDSVVNFDFSKFELKDVNGNVIPTNAEIHSLGANQPYVHFAFRMEVTGDLNIGDVISVYYDSEFIAEVIVSEL